LAAEVINGKKTAADIKDEISVEVTELRAKGITPGLGTLLVGDDPGSKSYVSGKHRDCQQVGIESIRVELPESASEKDIEAAINDLNNSPEVSGFIVQLPLPEGIDSNRLLEVIDPKKDADGLHPINLGRLVLNSSGEITSPLPCTPSGILELSARYGIETKGKKSLVIGRGVTVGRPLSLMLTRKGIDSTVQIAHSSSLNLPELISDADIVVAATGVPHMVKPEQVKPGAAVFDVGITRTDEGLIGDVHPDVANVAGWISPNPGGVGPMTRVMLLKNVLKLSKTGF